MAVSKIFFLTAAAVISTVTAQSQTCSASSPLSCSLSSPPSNLCCYNSPGGLLLQTQFWDTNPVTGPSNSWTIHGLWPDNCDGTYQANCDTNRAYTNISTVLQQCAPDTLSYMQTYWPDYQGNDETFWEHEWGKHGTCISTLNPSCYTSYYPAQEICDFFPKTVSLFKSLPTYTWLSNAGITPSSTATYSLSALQTALRNAFGFTPYLGCASGALDEVWYFYHTKGSVQSGTFYGTDSVTSSNCPSTGIKYLPKTTGGGGGGGGFSGSGNLQVSKGGCIISAGTWYTTGTCATFTATASGSGFTLKSSKGNCQVSGGVFSCASGNSATVFTSSGGNLAYSGSTSFYATSTPSGSTQATVYTTSKAVTFTISWTAA